jgi:DNA repair protein RecO (recombination protein O)
LHSLRQDIHKSSIIIFLAEILNKVIIEKDKNEALFSFLYEALITFDRVATNNNFHLQFLLQLAKILGFSVENPEDFINESNNQHFYQDSENREILNKLTNSSFDTPFNLDSTRRSTILNDIIFYYQQHLGITKLKSLEVLGAIFK